MLLLLRLFISLKSASYNDCGIDIAISSAFIFDLVIYKHVGIIDVPPLFAYIVSPAYRIGGGGAAYELSRSLPCAHQNAVALHCQSASSSAALEAIYR